MDKADRLKRTLSRNVPGFNDILLRLAEYDNEASDVGTDLQTELVKNINKDSNDVFGNRSMEQPC
jgi:hypothetical protein